MFFILFFIDIYHSLKKHIASHQMDFHFFQFYALTDNAKVTFHVYLIRFIHGATNRVN